MIGLTHLTILVFLYGRILNSLAILLNFDMIMINWIGWSWQLLSIDAVVQWYIMDKYRGIGNTCSNRIFRFFTPWSIEDYARKNLEYHVSVLYDLTFQGTSHPPIITLRFHILKKLYWLCIKWVLHSLTAVVKYRLLFPCEIIASKLRKR